MVATFPPKIQFHDRSRTKNIGPFPTQTQAFKAKYLQKNIKETMFLSLVFVRF